VGLNTASSEGVAATASISSYRMQSLNGLQRLLDREAAQGGVTISFGGVESESQQQAQPLAKVTMTITMEFGSNIESRLRGLWTDTDFELQLFLYESAQHPLGFTFSK